MGAHSGAILPVALQHVDARQRGYSLLPQRPRLCQGLLSLSLSLPLSLSLSLSLQRPRLYPGQASVADKS